MSSLIQNKNVSDLYLSHLTWTDYKDVVEIKPLIILPVGSVEQHGPHLPLLTDTILSTKLAEKIARKLSSFIAEPFTYGVRSDLFSGGGEAFLGTCSLSPETFLALTENILDELYLDGLRHFLILNGHFENASLLRESARRFTRKNPDAKILFCNWWDVPDLKVIRAYYPEDFPGMDLEHAGFLETSLMLYLASDSVKDPSFFPGETIKSPGYEIYPEHLNGLTKKSGALSSAKAANAKAGEEICELVIEGLIKAVESVFDSDRYMERDKLIFEGFLRWVKKDPDRLAILDSKESLTYQELYEKSCQIASTFNDIDIKSRYIFILGNKSSESIIAILGTLFAGFTYVALDINQPASRLDHIFSLLTPSVLIFTGISPRLEREIRQMKESPRYTLDLLGDLTSGIFKNAQCVNLKNKPIPPFSYSDEQIAYTLFTSGSTGQPKGVCISHRAARAALQMFQKHIGLKTQDIIANQAALCFDLSVFDIFGTLNSGATLCLIPPEVTALPDRFFQAIREYKATSLFTTPSTLDFLLTNTIASESNPSLEKILLSGEPVSPDLLEKIYNTFPDDIEVWNLYGATEIPYALAQPIKKNSSDQIKSFSLKGDEVEIKIRDSLFDNQKDTRIGELLVKGPAVLSGYIHKNNQEMSSPLIEGGWYPTGDLASMDMKNQITLHGRTDRQIKIKGHRVELDEIEFQLANCPEVQEVAIIFSQQTQEICAYLVLKPHNRSEQEVLEIIESFCERSLPSMFCPSKYNVVGNMPYTVSGKKDRKALVNA